MEEIMLSYKKNRMSKSITSLGIATNILVAIVMVIILYSLFFPYEPIEIKTFVKESTVSPGEEMTLSLIGNKKMPIPVEAFIELVDGGNYPIMTYFENNPVGTFNKVKKFIAPNINPGIYRVRWTGRYKINCIREVSVVVYSNEFYLR